MLKMLAQTQVGLHAKCLLWLSDCNQNWDTWKVFSRNLQYQIS
jgi:hypothetical protein